MKTQEQIEKALAECQKLFEETAVEISYFGITDPQGKLRTIYPTKKGAK